jgi:hypothetical protein
MRRLISRPRLVRPVVATLAVTCTTLALAGAGGVEAQASVTARPAITTQKWTKISKNTGFGIASAGLFRTGDGRLHVVWPSKDGATFSMHYSTVGGRAKLLATGTIVSGWGGISQYPRLVAGPGGGLRLVFSGGNGVGGSPYNSGAMYTETSDSAGTKWILSTGSLSQSDFVPLTDIAAATESDGTPIAAWSTNTALTYHVGVDPSIPAKSPDQTFGIGAAGGLGTPTLVRTTNGGILAGWFDTTGNSDEGYWVAQIWPSKGTKVKAPDSGGKHQNNGQPFQPVALTTRPGGGEYLAYCVPTKVLRCGHIALWKVGAAKALTVPGSSSGQATLVAIAPGRGGHLWLAWFDNGTNKVSVVRTNAAANGFGRVITFAAPSKRSASTVWRPRAAPVRSTSLHWPSSPCPTPHPPTGTPRCCPP